jgi:hypothetical protein
MCRVSKCPQPDMRLEPLARIAMLTSAGRVQRCRAPVMDPVLLLARPELMRVAPSGGLRARKHVAGTSVIGATLTSGNCGQGHRHVDEGDVGEVPLQRGHGVAVPREEGVDIRRASARRSVATFNSVGVTGREARQPRLRWARMAEMVAVVASALPPPNGAKPAKPCVSASNCR